MNTYYSKHFVQMSERKTLDELVRQTLLEKDLSYRKVAERSRGLIKTTTVHAIANRNIKRLSIDKLRGLAIGLGLPESEVFAAANNLDYAPDELAMATELQILFHGADDLSPPKAGNGFRKPC